MGRPVADATRTLSAVTLQAWDPFVLLTVTGEGFLYHICLLYTSREDIDLSFEEHLIVELYSR